MGQSQHRGSLLDCRSTSRARSYTRGMIHTKINLIIASIVPSSIQLTVQYRDLKLHSYHSIPFHIILFHVTSLHFIPFHSTSLHSFHFTSFHSISDNFIPFHFISFHFTSFYSTFTSLHFFPFLVQGDVWICMELMSTCLEKLQKRLKQPIPERILGKVAVATVRALHYLKEEHGVIHRGKSHIIILFKK